MNDETILLVDNDRFQDICDDKIMKSSGIYLFPELFVSFEPFSRFGPRREAETDASVIQPIAYCVIKGSKGVLCYRRKGNEGRLHGKISVGIGGHVSEDDRTDNRRGWFERTLLASSRRELAEEVGFTVNYDAWIPRGIIYDPSNEVGRHHFGLLYLAELELGSMLLLSDEIRKPTWLTEFPENLDEFETWSQIALTRLRGELFG